MSNELLAKIRKNREMKVKVGSHTFILRRPTDADMIDLSKRNADYFMIATEHVVGWEGVTENDVVGGGGSDDIKFDRRLWQEWCADRPDFWKALAEPAIEAYEQHKARADEAAKN